MKDGERRKGQLRGTARPAGRVTNPRTPLAPTSSGAPHHHAGDPRASRPEGVNRGNDPAAGQDGVRQAAEQQPAPGVRNEDPGSFAGSNEQRREAAGGGTDTQKEPAEQTGGKAPEAAEAAEETTDVPTDAEPAPAPEPEDDELSARPDPEELSVPRRFKESLRGPSAAFEFGDLYTEGPTLIGDTTVINMPGAGRERRFWRVNHPIVEVVEVSDWYAPSDIDMTLDRLLQTDHLVYLLGPAETGRYTSARCALARRHGSGSIADLQYTPQAEPADLAQQPNLLAPGTGHLLRMDGTPIDRLALMNIEMTARRSGASVIVIGDVTPEQVGSDRFVAAHRPARPDQVFACQLRRLLERKPGCVGHCERDGGCRRQCRQEYVTRLLSIKKLTAELSQMYHPREVVDLARTVADTMPDSDRDLNALLDKQFPRLLDHARRLLSPPQPSKKGFDDVGLVRRRQAFRIAFAVLEGCPLTVVADAAENLLRLLTPDAAEALPRAGTGAFEDGLEQLVPASMRVDRRADGLTAGGAQAAWLRRERLLAAMLQVVWNEFPPLQRVLLPWLDSIVRHRRAVVRQRVAVIAGHLLGFDWDLVFGKLIQGWAGSNRARSRQAAALACSYAAEDPQLAIRVRRAVRRWALDWAEHPVGERSPRLGDTAARAYASGLGARLPIHYVLANLWAIALDPRQVESPMVAMALEALLPRDASGKAGDLVEVLLTWLDHREPALGTHVARAVAHLVSCDDGVSRRPWPVLLRWAGQDDRRLGQLAVLWRHALLVPSSAFEAWRALGTWLSTATHDGELADVMILLLKDIWSDELMRIRARFHLDRMWQVNLAGSALPDRLRPLASEV